MTKPAQLLAIVAFTAAGSCAAPPPAPMYHDFAQGYGRQCFRADELYGFRRGPDRTVDVLTSRGRSFRLQLQPGCPDFSWIMQIGIRPVNYSWLCEGRPDQLITAFDSMMDRCGVSSIRLLAPGEAGLSWPAVQAASGAASLGRLPVSAAAIPPSASTAPAIASGVQR